MNFTTSLALDELPEEWHSIISEAVSGFQLDIYGIHGTPHWGRVFVNGMRLSEDTGANHKVVTAFALLHDCRRHNDGFDPEHGLRGAQHGCLLRDRMPSMSDVEFELFYEAAKRHSDGLVDADITIQTCWDADRLDLFRVGTYPDPQYLCTETAKRPEIIDWAVARSTSWRLEYQ